MSEALRNQLINALKKNDELFTVNGSWETTEKIKKAMMESNWSKVSGQAKIQPAQPFLPRYRSEFNEHYDAVERMRQNRNVAELIPEHTRLAFIKKLIVRIMRVSTGFQQDFNTAACDSTDILVEYAMDASRQIDEQNDIIEKQGKLLNELLAEQERLHRIIDRLGRDGRA